MSAVTEPEILPRSPDDDLRDRALAFLGDLGIPAEEADDAVPAHDDLLAIAPCSTLLAGALLDRIPALRTAASAAAVRVAAARHLYRSPGAGDGSWPSFDELGELVPTPATSREAVAALVVPCRDDGLLLIDALASVRLCATERFELVVADDGSSEPGTLRLLRDLERLGIAVARCEPGGPSRARNAGVAFTSSPYVFFLDSDDLLRPGVVAAATAQLDGDPEVGSVLPATWSFGPLRAARPAPPVELTRLLTGNYLECFSIVRRAAIEEVGGWDERFIANEDWDLWLSLVGAGWRLERPREPSVGGDIRVRPASQRSKLDDPVLRVEIAVRIAEKHRALYSAHLGGVIRNYATVVVIGDNFADADAGAASEPGGAVDDGRAARELSDELAAARAEVCAQAAAAAAARDVVAEMRERLEQAESSVLAAEARATEALSRAAEAAAAAEASGAACRVAEQRAAGCEAELAAIRGTRTFRWLAPVRDLYGRVRRPRRR